jgi:hypothetical protein
VQPIAGERAEEGQQFHDLVTTDRVEESRPTSPDPDARPPAVSVIGKLDAQVADQAPLADGN